MNASLFTTDILKESNIAWDSWLWLAINLRDIDRKNMVTIETTKCGEAKTLYYTADSSELKYIQRK